MSNFHVSSIFGENPSIVLLTASQNTHYHPAINLWQIDRWMIN
jgi:hypothetical protein